MRTSDRRIFLKKLLGASAGLLVSSSNFASGWHSAHQIKEISKTGPIFPFYPYVPEFNIGDYLPKDQGGKFIQMETFGTEEDHVIVQMIRGGILKKIYGDPIQWSRFEAGEVEKSVWLNRFYYLPSFARQYYLAADKTYISDMMEFIAVWIRENPLLPDSPHQTYNWRDMQVAWRSINLSWCYFLSENALTVEQKVLIENSLKQHADILLSGFGRQPLNEFNHQSHGALAMLYLGILFPSFETAAQLREKGLDILSHHLEKAFYRDGGNVEQMFGYYPFEAQIFRDSFLLCSTNGVEPPHGIVEGLEKMALFLSVVSQPNGAMPPVNDSYEMPAGPTIASVNGILGKDDHAGEQTSRYFPDSQIAVMRQNAGPNSWYVLAYPAQAIGSHDHAGRLAFTLWLNGKPVLIDSGCTNYDNPKLVSWYRTSRAHNTVLIDGKSDEATSSNRLWTARRITANRITHWVNDKGMLFCRMVSPESEPTNNSVFWSRSLILVKNEMLILHDRFEATNSHSYEMLFHFPQVDVAKNENRKAILLHGGEAPLAILPADPRLIESLALPTETISVKGRGTPAPMASFRFKAEGEVHSVILFLPGNTDLSTISVSQQVTDDGVGVILDKGEGQKIVLLLRNPESEELSVLGKQTTKLFEAFNGTGKME